MLLFEFFAWWYGRGFSELFSKLGRYTTSIWRSFSVLSLIKTLFDPWRRITTDPGKSLQDKWRALADNMVSRFVGFAVRSLVIFTALISIVTISIFGLVSIIAWPLVPILILLSVVGVLV